MQDIKNEVLELEKTNLATETGLIQNAKEAITHYISILQKKEGASDSTNWRSAEITVTALSPQDIANGITKVKTEVRKSGYIYVTKYKGTTAKATYTVRSDGRLDINQTGLNKSYITLNERPWLGTVQDIINEQSQETAPTSEVLAAKTESALADLSLYIDKLKTTDGRTDAIYLKTITVDGVQVSLLQDGRVRIQKSGDNAQNIELSLDGKLTISESGMFAEDLSLAEQPWSADLESIRTAISELETNTTSAISTEISDLLAKLETEPGAKDVTYQKIATIDGARVGLRLDGSIRIEKAGSFYELSADGKLTVSTASFSKQDMVLDSQPWAETVERINTAQTTGLDEASVAMLTAETQSASADLTLYLAKLQEVTGTSDDTYLKYALLTGDDISSADLEAGTDKVWVYVKNDGECVVKKSGNGSTSYKIDINGKLTIMKSGFFQDDLELAETPWVDTLTAIGTQVENKDATMETQAQENITAYLDKLKDTAGLTNEIFLKTVKLSGEELTQADQDSGYTQVLVSVLQNGVIELRKSGAQAMSYVVGSDGKLTISSEKYFRGDIEQTITPWTATITAIQAEIVNTDSGQVETAKAELSYYLDKLSTVNGNKDAKYLKIVTLSGNDISETDRNNGVVKVWVYAALDGQIRVQKEGTQKVFYDVTSDGKLTISTADYYKRDITLDSQPWSDTIQTITSADTTATTADSTDATARIEQGQTEIATYLDKLNTVSVRTDATYLKVATLTGNDLTQADRDAGVTAVWVYIKQNGELCVKKTGGDFATYKLDVNGKLSITGTDFSQQDVTPTSTPWTASVSAIQTQVDTFKSEHLQTAKNDIGSYLEKLAASPGSTDETDLKTCVFTEGATQVKVSLRQDGGIRVDKSGDVTASYVISSEGLLSFYTPELVQEDVTLEASPGVSSVASIKAEISALETNQIKAASDGISNYLNILKDVEGTSDRTYVKVATLIDNNIAQSDRDAGITSVWVYLKRDGSVRVQKKADNASYYYDLNTEGKLSIQDKNYFQRDLAMETQPWAEDVQSLIDSELATSTEAIQQKQNEMVNKASNDLAHYMGVLADIQGGSSASYLKYVTLTGDQISGTDQENGVSRILITVKHDGEIRLIKNGPQGGSVTVKASGQLTIQSPDYFKAGINTESQAWNSSLGRILRGATINQANMFVSIATDDSQFVDLDGVTTITAADGTIVTYTSATKTLSIGDGETITMEETESSAFAELITNKLNILTSAETVAVESIQTNALGVADDSQLTIGENGLYTVNVKGKLCLFDSNTNILTNLSGKQFKLDKQTQIDQIMNTITSRRTELVAAEIAAIDLTNSAISNALLAENISVYRKEYTIETEGGSIKFDTENGILTMINGQEFMLGDLEQMRGLQETMETKKNSLIQQEISVDLEYYSNLLSSTDKFSLSIAQLKSLNLKKFANYTGDSLSEADQALGITEVRVTLDNNDRLIVEKKINNRTLSKVISQGSSAILRTVKSGQTRVSEATIETQPWQVNIQSITDALESHIQNLNAQAEQARLDLEQKQEAAVAQLTDDVKQSINDTLDYYANILKSDTSETLSQAQKNALQLKKLVVIKADAISESDRKVGIDEVRVYLNIDNKMIIEKRRSGISQERLERVGDSIKIIGGTVAVDTPLSFMLAEAEIQSWTETIVKIDEKIEVVKQEQAQAAEEIAKAQTVEVVLTEEDQANKSRANNSLNYYTDKLVITTAQSLSAGQMRALGIRKLCVLKNDSISEDDRRNGINQVKVYLSVFNTIIVEKLIDGRLQSKVTGAETQIIMQSRLQGAQANHYYRLDTTTLPWIERIRQLTADLV